METLTLCSHVWIDPEDPPIERSSYAPIIGELRRQMKPGRNYRCQNCGAVLYICPMTGPESES